MIFWRGLRWRAGFSLAVLVVGIVGAAVAALGPVYARAAAESALTDELRAAGSQAGLAFTQDSSAGGGVAAARFWARAGAGARVPGFGAPVRGESLLATARAGGDPASTPTTLAYRSGVCAHVTLSAGRCPTAAGEAMVAAADADLTPRWQPGATLDLHQAIPVKTGVGVLDGEAVGRVRVVGVYRARDVSEAYWSDQPYFASRYGPSVTGLLETGADAVFVPAAQFARMPALTSDPARHLDLGVPVAAARVRLADVPALRRTLHDLHRRFPREPPGGTRPGLRTGLPAVLDRAAADERAIDDATLLVVLELAALSLLVLYQVVGGAVAGRGGEIALAKLRGLGPYATVRFALREPLSLLLIAAPLGLALADVVARVLAGAVLLPGTPVALPGAAGWALLAAYLGGAVAAALAARSTLTRSVLDQWRSTARRPRPGRALLALDLAVAVAAGAALVALRDTAGGRRPAQWLLAGPALLVFAVALVGTRLLPRVLRRPAARTRATRHVAAFVALRQTLRRPGGLRLAVLLAVAGGLATFAICGEAVARGNRAARAETEIGAPVRLAVLDEPGHDPQAVLDAVDPRRHWSMAVASWYPDGGPPVPRTVTGTVLGVEPAGLPATAYRVRGQLAPRAIAAAVGDPSVPPPAEFHAASLSVTLDAGRVTGDRRPEVVLGYRHGRRPPTRVGAGTLRPGRHRYAARVPCRDGCDFTGFSVDRSVQAADTVTGSLTVTQVEAGAVAVPVRLDAAAWRPARIGTDASATLRRTAGGLLVGFRSSGGSVPVIGYEAAPARVPIVATPAALTAGSATGAVTDAGGTELGFRVARRAGVLPAVLDRGAVADLDYLRLGLPYFDRESTWGVWLGPRAPADALARLRRAGLLVEHRDTAAARVAALRRQGPALGLLLLLVCAVAATLLAAGGTAVALLAESRRRAYELAALRVVGVRHRVLRRSAVLEQGLLLGSAAALGLFGGYLAALVALPVVPEFADGTPVVLRYGPPVLLALAAAAAFALVLLVLAGVAGTALARAAVPSRLRGS